MKRPVLAAAVLYALLAVAFVSPALVPGKTLSASDYLWTNPVWGPERPEGVKPFGANFEHLDEVLQYQQFRRYARERLPDPPLWNPHISGGRPFIGNAQSAVFSPFSIPAYVTPLAREHAWAVALKLFVAALGAYLLARALRLRFWPSLLAGVVYAYSLYFVGFQAWVLSDVWAWLPWVLALTDLVVRRPAPLPVAGLAAVVALQFFGGHPESSFHVMVAAVAFLVLRLFVHRPKPLRRPLLGFAGGAALGGLLAAVALVPLAELILNSSEFGERTGQAPDEVSPRYLLAMVLADYWGRPTQEPLIAFFNSHAFYVGALTLMLAIAAPILRPSLERLAIAAFGVGALAVVTGAPLIHRAVNALPVFTTVHNSRMVIYFVLAAALLAAFALDDLFERAPERRRRSAVLAVALGLLCLPLSWLAIVRPSLSAVGPALEVASGFADPPRDADTIRLASLILWTSFAGVAALLLVLRLRGRLSGRAFAVAAVALVVADLFRVGVGLNPAIDDEVATVPPTPVIEYLREQRPDRFAGTSSRLILPPIEPNVAMQFGLYDARGYDFPVEKRYAKLWRRAVFGERGFVTPEAQAPIDAGSLRALNLLSTAHILQPADDPPLRRPELREVLEEPGGRIYENEGALPRALLVGAARLAFSEQQALDAVLDPGFDGRRVAILEDEEGLGLGDRPGAAGSARIVEYEPERVVVEARATRRSLLVLTDLYFPGWKAEVDGRETPVHRVNYLLRGVPLYAGAHRIEFRYEPLSWRIGWIGSLAGLLILAGLVAAGGASRLRRRSRGERAS